MSEHIWSVPLTENERAIIEATINEGNTDALRRWLRHLLTVYDGQPTLTPEEAQLVLRAMRAYIGRALYKTLWAKLERIAGGSTALPEGRSNSKHDEAGN